MKTKTLIASLLFCSLGYSQGKFFGGNGDGFSSATLDNIVLPLQIIDFSVSKNGNEVKANLKISPDEAVCKIVLEKSEDAFSYTEADKIGNGNTPILITDFLFTDRVTTEKTLYYRAKVIKCSGGIIYSRVVSIKNDKTQNRFYYSFTNRALHYNVKQNDELQLVNAYGQLVYKTNLTAGSGVLNFSTLAPGIYLLHFSNEKAVKIFVQ